MHRRQAGRHVVCQAHVAAAQLDLGQLHRLAHHVVHLASCAIGLAALHEGADALDDLAGALGLARGLVQRAQQVVLADLPFLMRETMPLQ
jgi:hypothetical protein